MEWIVTEARTVADAKEVALDQLGVDEREAEFEVLAEPQRGLFGMGRTRAQVRARVMPRLENTRDGRNRQRKGRGSGNRRDGPRRQRQREQPQGAERRQETKQSQKPAQPAARQRERSPRRRPTPRTQRETTNAARGREDRMNRNESDRREEVFDATTQEEIVCSFTQDLVDAFGLDATVTANREDEGVLEVVVQGDEVGLLIGRRGGTLAAVEELLRVVVQRRAQGRRYDKVRLEVGGYRRRRREALEEFARRVAEDVIAAGEPKMLEPMNSADRKIVHDAIVEVDGVQTASEGEEPRRRVVVSPES